MTPRYREDETGVLKTGVLKYAGDTVIKLVERLIRDLDQHAKLEQPPQMHGRRIVVIFAPK